MQILKQRISWWQIIAGTFLLGLIIGLIWGVRAMIGSLFPEKTVASMPFTLDHNRMLVEVEFVRPDHSLRKATAWVDTGSEYLTLAETLSRELGLEISALDGEENEVQLNSPAPAMHLQGMPLHVDGVKTRVHKGACVRPGVAAEANLPARILAHHHVIFDYPHQRLIVARPGILKPKGTAIPCRINPATGLFLINVSVDGDTLHWGLDNGSAGTWVADTLTTLWQRRHPNWPTAIGAAGSANFFGFPFETRGVLMRLPVLEIGGASIKEVALLGLDKSLFDWYSKKSAGPVLGFIGANVLKNFRLEIDFPNQMTYWEKAPVDETQDLDLVGLTLRPEADNSLSVISIVTQNGKQVVNGILPGDRLLRIDKRDVSAERMGAAIQALRGSPGSLRNLVVERNRKKITVAAKVMHLP